MVLEDPLLISRFFTVSIWPSYKGKSKDLPVRIVTLGQVDHLSNSYALMTYRTSSKFTFQLAFGI